MNKMAVIFIAAAIVPLMFVTGCGKKTSKLKVDENKPLNEVKLEAQNMDQQQLRQMTRKYKEAIRDKEPEITDLMKELQEQPLTGLDSEEIKARQEEIDEITTSLGALKSRYQIYYDRLVEMNADVTGLDLSSP